MVKLRSWNQIRVKMLVFDNLLQGLSFLLKTLLKLISSKTSCFTTLSQSTRKELNLFVGSFVKKHDHVFVFYIITWL